MKKLAASGSKKKGKEELKKVKDILDFMETTAVEIQPSQSDKLSRMPSCDEIQTEFQIAKKVAETGQRVRKECQMSN